MMPKDKRTSYYKVKVRWLGLDKYLNAVECEDHVIVRARDEDDARLKGREKLWGHILVSDDVVEMDDEYGPV